MTNKEKFLSLVSTEKTKTLDNAKNRIANREMLRFSQKIAFAILNRLDDLKWTQTKLAIEIGLPKQQINKWLKGKENFTIETILKISEVLKLELIEIPKLSTGVEVSENTAFIETVYKLTPPKASKTLIFENIVEEEETLYQVNYTK